MAIAERRGNRCLNCWWSLAYRVLFFILASSALFCGPLRAEGIEAARYRLAPGDKIEIIVLGQEELSGAFTVDSTGSVQLLIVGNLPVKGLTIEDVKKRIVDRLSDGYIKEPLVNVRVSEPRPVFILGNVRRAGSYQFRYGSTVKSLLAEAGGIGSPETEHATVADFLAADERLKELKQSHKALIIRLARTRGAARGKRKFYRTIFCDLGWRRRRCRYRL